MTLYHSIATQLSYQSTWVQIMMAMVGTYARYAWRRAGISSVYISTQTMIGDFLSESTR